MLKEQKAAGLIWRYLDNAHKVHVRDLQEDPVQMWKKLEEIGLQRRPVTRFNALDALFSIRKDPEETLPALAGRIEDAMQAVQNLCPSNFTLSQSDDELVCMGLISMRPEQSAVKCLVDVNLSSLHSLVLQQA